MSISMNRIKVLSAFKMRELIKNKTFLLSLILVPGFTLIMRLAYQSITKGEMPPLLFGMVLNLGVLFNLTMISLIMPATMLAKDKEKNTLRTLMTSSVEGIEYFISGVFPAFLVSFLVNLAVLLISGISLASINLPLYIVVTAIAGLTSCVIGMIVGIFSKNQMASSNLSSVVMLLLMMVPLFGNMVPSLQNLSGFLYTGIVSNMITAFAAGEGYQPGLGSWCILLGTLIICVIAFILCYRRNGFEKD